MFQIGPSLAAARQARGLSLHDAEQLTCMRGKYLIALEEERFDDLPGRTYARTFLRTYATALGLDGDRFVAEFEEQMPEPDEPQEVGRTRPRRRMHWAPLVALACGILFAIVVWSAWSNGTTGGPVAVHQPPKAAAAVRPRQHHATHARVVRKTVKAAPAALVVAASRGPCWVLARRGGPAGPILYERILAQGESIRFTARKVWLRLGAPWNVRVARGGHVLRGTAAAHTPLNALL